MTQQEQNTHASLTPQELGTQLRLQREKKGLSIGEVSERLKLPARQIESLEQGDYDALPEMIFVRGFLRSYGRFLDFDDALLSESLDKIVPKNQGNKISYLEKSLVGKDGKPFPTWILGLLAVIGIGYGVYVWQNKSQAEHNKQEAATTVLTASNPLSASAPAAPQGNVIVKPMSASDMQTAVARTASSADASSPAAMGGELVINTRYRTMLTVTNAQGEVLINQIVPARSEHRFTTGAPFEVRIGYASGSTATFDGKAIDLDAVRKDGKTVAFTAGDNTIFQ